MSGLAISRDMVRLMNESKLKTTIATAVAVCSLIGLVFGGVVAADARYVSATDFQSFAVEDYYEKYYHNEDLMLEAQKRNDHEAVRKYRRNMERLAAKICAINPDWERCSGDG